MFGEMGLRHGDAGDAGLAGMWMVFWKESLHVVSSPLSPARRWLHATVRRLVLGLSASPFDSASLYNSQFSSSAIYQTYHVPAKDGRRTKLSHRHHHTD